MVPGYTARQEKNKHKLHTAVAMRGQVRSVGMELFEFSSSCDEILCVDRFIGDQIFNQLCDQISQQNSTYSNAVSLILRGNCLGMPHAPYPHPQLSFQTLSS